MLWSDDWRATPYFDIDAENDRIRLANAEYDAQRNGALLRHAREAAGLTIDDLAAVRIQGRPETAHMQASEFRNIEDGDLDAWSGVPDDFYTDEYLLLIAAAQDVRRAA